MHLLAPRRRVVAALVTSLSLAGCSHGGPAPATTASATRGSPTTTLARARPTVFPLTGLPASSTTIAGRPALSIKVENTPDARPQAGLGAADIVTEELVEGGITRFLATFQSRDAPLVGPVRSARPVDAALLRELGGGLFGYAGAAAGEIAPIRAYSTATLVGAQQAPEAYWRLPSRPAPHNLYTSTTRLYQAGQRLGGNRAPPSPLFQFSEQVPPGTHAARGIVVPFSPVADYVATWRWDAAAGDYDRYQGGRRATQAGGGGIRATDVIVLSVKVGTIPGLVDSLGNPDPNVLVVGRGACWVLREGRVLRGTWQRSSVGQAMRLVGNDGRTIPLHPGRTWIELEPVGFTPRLL